MIDEDEEPAGKKPDAKEADETEGSVDPEEKEAREKLMRQLKHKEGKKKRNRNWADANQDPNVTRKSQSFEPPRRPRIPRRP